MWWVKSGLCLAIVLFLGIQLSAQQTNAQFWLDFNPSYRVAERVTLYGKIGIKTNSPHTWTRYLITPSIKYNWPRLILRDYKFMEELHAGVGVYYTNNVYFSDSLEIRPFQGYSLTIPNRRMIAIKHFIMLEERFELNTDNWENTFGLRLRYKASVTFRFHGDLWAPGKGFYIPLSCEFFWNLISTKQFNDIIRVVGGLGYEFLNHWKTAFLVGYNLSRVTVEESFNLNDILFRFRVYYRIN